MESSVSYEPKFGRVLIKREIKEKVGSIILPDAKRHAKCDGIIVALGETAGWVETYSEHWEQQVGSLGGSSIHTVSKETHPKRIMKVGDHVIFGRHSGAWLDATYTNGSENDDGSLFICQDADILCVIKGESK